ncbi:All-trans-phytoene synthase [Streptomyces sp. YIM 130001]|uniref:phytoene/squalene synthase family protein n=1 Tax=Streptomyces sp. YIM 130001 TaxID=2259644 RepID=UPI000ECF7D52|nr:phytoene/squalene synthase family protein [Streptomyces sp. YIM 130001]RII20579.1 All-trans-phytoene synthase [Streptomyces sp. YIM 130001]
MFGAEKALTSAGITDPLLREAYSLCRRVLISADGAKWDAGLLTLPPAKRPAVWALYGFARWADEIVDSGDPATRATELAVFTARVVEDLEAGYSRDPFSMALLDTLRTWDIAPETVTAYLESMRRSLTVTEYRTYAELRDYTDDAIVSVGRQVLAVLEPSHDGAYARMDSLSTAMYLTDILKDLGEDLSWGRLYLPLEELEAFGVDRSDLERGVLTPPVRELLRFQVDRIRRLYDEGMAVARHVHPGSRDFLRLGTEIFRGTLEKIEQRGYDVFTPRPWISTAQLPGLLWRVGSSTTTRHRTARASSASSAARKSGVRADRS